MFKFNTVEILIFLLFIFVSVKNLPVIITY
jgi:hypothetical protein